MRRIAGVYRVPTPRRAPASTTRPPVYAAIVAEAGAHPTAFVAPTLAEAERKKNGI